MGGALKRVDIFPTLDGEGERLADRIRDVVRSVSPRAEVRMWTSTEPGAVMRSTLAADVVVLDLTPGPDGVHRYTAMAYPWRLPHVLVVSRSYLPINVAPARPGGAAVYPGAMTDDGIAAWVLDQLSGDDPLSARSFGQKLRPWRGAGATGRGRSGVFISYRTRDLDHAVTLHDDLRDGRYHGGTAPPVHLYRPGQLAAAAEVLPALLRWNVLSTISDVVRGCTEMWVIDSGDYLASWWTQGELVCRPYFADHVAIRVFDPLTGAVGGDDGRFSATMTDVYKRRMARLFANSHPDMMAPESSRAMREWRTVGLPMSRDEVFDENFARVPLLQCPRCSLAGTGPSRLDIARFLANQDPTLYPVPPVRLRDGATIDCPDGCGQTFAVTSSPPRYLWYALPVAGTGSYLEPIPTFSAAPVPAGRPD